MENLCEDIVALRLKHFTPWSLKARGGGGWGRGRTPGNSWLVFAARFSKYLTLFQTKKCNFPHPFSELALRQKLYYYLD